MTMKKVIAFTLVILLALGGMVFAHAAVTAEQEQLSFYPTLEIGDPSVLNGVTVSTPLKCGSHLSWTPQHTFGGNTVTEFTYSRQQIKQPVPVQFRMDVSLLDDSDVRYSSQHHSTFMETPAGSSLTRTFPLREIRSEYSPHFRIEYQDEVRVSEDFYRPEIFSDLSEMFRFPVQENDTLTIHTSKNSTGGLDGSSASLNIGPQLDFCYDMNADGVWFLLQFQNETGVLPYEAPYGYGIYFMPWKTLDYSSPDGDVTRVRVDTGRLQLSVPLEAGPRNEALLADPERKLIHLLTLEDGMYVLSTYDLDSGDQRARLELLPQDPDRGTYCTIYRHLGDQLLLYIQGHLILTDAAGEALLLTAPVPQDRNFNIANFKPETYDLYFDGETLFIAGFYSSRPYSFAITAWSEGAQTYYGEYSCTLTEGNGDWYYSPVELTDLTLKGG